MIGCFNVTLYAYFDIHRIFDLILFSMWDFMLWWFDLDFMLFDFNFDFVICLSFLFLFLLNFFFKMLFSFLYNFMTRNYLYPVMYTFYICYTIMNFVSFLFIFGLFYLLLSLDTYTFTCNTCFNDYTSFSDLNCLLFFSKNSVFNTFYSYILFYFVVNIMMNITFLFFSFFFSQSYFSGHCGTDIHKTNKFVELSILGITTVIILDINHMQTKWQASMYYYMHALFLNCMYSFTIMHMFYTYSILFFLNNLVTFNIYFIKIMKYLCNMEICYSFIFYSNLFSSVTFLFVMTYILFTMNFLHVFMKDFMYISTIMNIYTLFFNFMFMNFNFSHNIFLFNKKQLIYLTYC